MLTLREIIQELFYEKTRAVLTILAIAWGAFSITIMLAIGEGLRLNFFNVMANAGDKLLSITPGMTTKNYRGVHAGEAIRFSKRDALAVSELPNIGAVSIRYRFTTNLRYRDKEIFSSLQAVTPEYAAIHNMHVGSRQRFISFLDMQNRSSVIVSGEKAASRMFPNEDPVGNTIYISNHPFLVIGVMQKKPQMSSVDIPDSWSNWIPASTYELLNNPKNIDAIDVVYKDYDKIEQTKNSIQKVIAMIHGADPGDIGVMNFRDIAKEQKEVNNFFIRLQMFFGFVGGLTLFLAGVGIANVMYASVKRQTCQIGVRMALGATTWHIVYRYIIESFVATLIGGAIGMFITLIFVYLVRLIPMESFMLEEYFGKPRPVLSLLVIAIVIGVLGVTGFLAGLFPAIKAAKIDPAEALVYE